MRRDPRHPNPPKTAQGWTGVSSCLFLTLSLLGAAGCQPAKVAGPNPGNYRFSGIAPNAVDHEIEFYEARCKQRPDSAIERTALAQAYLGKAQATAKPEYFALADKAAQEALKLHPDYNQAELIVASLHEARHDFQGAYEITDKLYEADHEDVGAKALLTNSLIELGRLKEAQTVGASVMQKWPTTSSMVLVARTLILQGHDEQGEALLLQAMPKEQADEKKASARLRSLLGDMYLREGRLELARSWLNQSLLVTRNNFPALITLARVEGREGHWSAMEQLYTEAFAFTQNPAYLSEMGYAQKQQGRAADAKNSIDNSLALLQKVLSQEAYGHARDLARAYLLSGRPKDALPVVLKERLQRNDWKLKEVIGTTYGALGQWKEALASYQEALDTGYREPVVYELAAEACDALKDNEKAQTLRKQASAIDPSFKREWVEF